jgi:hypothetical protein
VYEGDVVWWEWDEEVVEEGEESVGEEAREGGVE